jgi:hypothetical protein
LSYRRAFQAASELYVASAFLTEWTPQADLNKNCRKLIFLVGTDFGITKKSACHNVLRWLPKKFASDFLAVPSMAASNFHPKIVTWKDFHGQCYAIIGSSNLTQAAFNSNYEANVLLNISLSAYHEIVQWIEGIASQCQVITKEWIEQYSESHSLSKKASHVANAKRVINLKIPTGTNNAWRWKERRLQQKAFSEIGKKLIVGMKACKDGRITNLEFWSLFKTLWSKHRSRFQGSGFQITAKNANWRQVCSSMLIILGKSEMETEIGLDNIVKHQIDLLAKFKNAVRGA